MPDTHAAFNDMLHRILTESIPQGLWAFIRGFWWIILLALVVLYIKARMDRSDREERKKKQRAARDEEYRRMAKIFREVNEKKDSREK